MRLTIMDKGSRLAMLALAVSLIDATAAAQSDGSPTISSSATVDSQRNPAPPFV